jgi:multidrug transporter EmrE-like cation transporter
MTSVSPNVILMIALSVAFQLIGVFLLPMTKGLTQPLPTIAGAIAFLIGLGLMARLSASGVNLSVLLPLMAALVPLGAVAIGVLAYGDSASLPKIFMLVAACGLIGYASTV